MKRREFISLLGGAAAWPLVTLAQEPSRMRRVGVLLGFVESDPEAQPRIAAFQRELQNLGWTVGRNLQIEYRWAGSDAERFRVLAAELVATSPDVLVAHATPSVEALARETRTIPIIFAAVTDPIRLGLAASLREPGGNITGFTMFDPSMGAKWVEFSKEFSPRLARVALLFNPETAPGRGSLFVRPLKPLPDPWRSSQYLRRSVTLPGSKMQSRYCHRVRTAASSLCPIYLTPCTVT
jgi:putative tryptophan/tyrosine transport system substrate-binding protein